MQTRIKLYFPISSYHECKIVQGIRTFKTDFETSIVDYNWSFESAFICSSLQSQCWTVDGSELLEISVADEQHYRKKVLLHLVYQTLAALNTFQISAPEHNCPFQNFTNVVLLFLTSLLKVF